MTSFTSVKTLTGTGFDKSTALFGAAIALTCIHEGASFGRLAFEGSEDCRTRDLIDVDDPVARARIALAGPAMDLLLATIEDTDEIADAHAVCGQMLISWQEDASTAHGLYHRDLLGTVGLVSAVAEWVVALIIANAELVDLLSAELCAAGGQLDYESVVAICAGRVADANELAVAEADDLFAGQLTVLDSVDRAVLEFLGGAR